MEGVGPNTRGPWSVSHEISISKIIEDAFSMVSLTSLLMTNTLTVVAKVFSNTLIFLLQKCESKSFSHFFQQKISIYFSYFKIKILMSLS